MRRYLPHLLILLTGLFCLALTWYYEPPIQHQQPFAKKVRNHQTIKRDYHLRVLTSQPLDLQSLTLTITWDKSLLTKPKVRHGRLTRKTRPQTRHGKNMATIIFENRQGNETKITGRGPLARLAFHRHNRNVPVPQNAVRVVSATGVRPDGTKVKLKKLSLVKYTPKRENVLRAARDGRNNE